MHKVVGVGELEAEFCEALQGVKKIRACWIDNKGEARSTLWVDNTEAGRRSVSECISSLEIESLCLNITVDAWIETQRTTVENVLVAPEGKHLRLIVDNTDGKRKRNHA